MGLLQEGKWVDRWYQTKDTGGRFVRKSASFRNWITSDGNAGPSGTGGFKAEIGRYHLYVSLACPWAHRTLILRSLKGLEPFISVSVVHWFMAGDGWTFEPGKDVVPDTINGFKFLHQVYTAAAPDYSGRVTVPVLWDKKSKTIVSNESSEIIRMLNNAFDDLGAKPGDYYPEEFRPEIDDINKRVYSSLNNGVYKCGFARNQESYEKASNNLFKKLDEIDQLIQNSGGPWIFGNKLTYADLYLFPTIIRWELIYSKLFKCTQKEISEYKNILKWRVNFYKLQGIPETCFEKQWLYEYYQGLFPLNPNQIVPLQQKLKDIVNRNVE